MKIEMVVEYLEYKRKEMEITVSSAVKVWLPAWVWLGENMCIMFEDWGLIIPITTLYELIDLVLSVYTQGKSPKSLTYHTSDTIFCLENFI